MRTSCSSPMVRAPSAAIAVRMAPARFCVPALTVAGPYRIYSSEALVPTLMRVPRGSVPWKLAMPQL
jgi:hypothetical protein